MATAESPQWQNAPLLVLPEGSLWSPEKLPERRIYVTSNERGIDLGYSHFPRRPDVAAHERASLVYLAFDKELSHGVKIWVGANANNKVTEDVFFEKIRRPDEVGIGEDGIVLAEDTISKGEDFANKARTKIDSLPKFVERLIDNSTLYINSLWVWFNGTDIQRKIPGRMVIQHISQMDLIFLTPFPENKKILEKIGKGQFRSVTHRFVPSPQVVTKAA